MTLFLKQQSSISSDQHIERPIWDNWRWVWYAFFYAVLLFADIVCLATGVSGWWADLMLIVFNCGIGAWYFIYIRVDPAYWEQHKVLMLLYFCAGWAFWYSFTIPFSPYLFLLSGLCPQVFMLSRLSWRISASTFLTALGLGRLWYMSGIIDQTFLIIMVFSVGSILLGIFITMLIRQSQQRYRLLLELRETRQELALVERHAGIVEERHRLAGEIHDTLAQGFTSIIMHIASVNDAVKDVPDGIPSLQWHLEQIDRVAHENLAQSRQLMWALRPELFARASLSQVLDDLLQQWSAESAVSGRFVVTGTPCILLPEVEVLLLRVAQEGLTNIRKHASAAHVVLTLSYLGDVVALDVQDDGRGFEYARLKECQSIAFSHKHPLSGHFGLKTMCERIEQCNGTFSLESTCGEGTVLAITLPVTLQLPHCAIPRAGKREGLL